MDGSKLHPCARCGFAPCMCSPSDRPPIGVVAGTWTDPVDGLPRAAVRIGGATPYPLINGGATKESALRRCCEVLEQVDDEDRVRVVDALVALMRLG